MPHAWSSSSDGSNFRTNRERERAILRLASSQKQLIRSQQLIALGMAASTITYRARSGRLHQIHRGVFATHPPPYSPQQMWLAAVYACGTGAILCGTGAILSEWCAAAHLRLTENRPTIVDLTNPTGAGRGTSGVVVHRRQVDKRDVWRKQGIPTTTAARTIIDCARTAGLEGTEELIMSADSIRVLDRRRLEELAHEHRGRPGIKHVLILITDDPPELRSMNEGRMFSICRRFAVPKPRTNHRIDTAGRTFYADFCWPDLHLIVEADSWRWHGGRLASESEADRDQLLAIAGWRVVHFTRDQIKGRMDETGRRLVALTKGSAL